MKKNNYLRILLVICLIASLAVFMCSCGSKGGKSEKAETGTETEEKAEEKTEKEEKTLESHFKEHPEELDEIKQTVLEDEDMKQALEILDFDVYAKGNTLYYEYQFKETYSDENVKAMQAKMPDTFDGLEEDMTSRLSLIEAGYGVEDVTIHIAYKNGDGSVIGERDYTK